MKRTDPKGSWALYASHLGGYMRRWILRTPWFNLRVHNIRTSDEGLDFHDHPFDFTSLILWGGYTEHRPGCDCEGLAFWKHPSSVSLGPCRRYGPGSIVRRNAEDLHRLELSRPAWTFVLAGPRRRKWGLLTPKGWVPYDAYSREYL